MIRYTVFILFGTVRLPIEICSEDTIYQVKQQIEKLENLVFKIKPKDQVLMLGQKEFQDNLKVSESKIYSKDKIRLIQKVEGKIQIFIIEVDRGNKSTAIIIEPSATVLDLRKQYCNKTGLEEELRFSFKGHELENKHTLEHYEIQGGSTIHLFARVYGGL
ncbi:hypothetical protein C1645_791338 [Glomus cerebriforme]|uniref:Ubiquitin-like domain-containing protein n=1 Tax=Glomus cerebriforme TaxID=658196 RepID=A0A397SAN9_9GLOM|nr:hypothetical protein C1645_791338 [Glomus cerebriforme]